MKPITLSDIAKELGVSKATVDRAIHNRPDVSKVTRQMVLELVDKYDYKPDPIARSLSLKSKPKKIGVIIPRSPEAFWNAVVNGIVKAQKDLFDCAPEVVFHQLKSDHDENDIVLAMDDLVSERVDGIILVPLDNMIVRRKINYASDRGVITATLNDDVSGTNRLFYVGSEQKRSGRLAGELMGKFLRGSGRVIIIKRFVETSEYKERLDGFLDVLKERYPDIFVEVQFSYNMDNVGEIILKSILQSTENIDGIYDVDDTSLYTVGMLLKELDLKNSPLLIGHEISEEVRELFLQGILHACISQNPFSQGYCSLRELHRLLVEEKMPEFDKIYTRLDIILRDNAENFQNFQNY